MRWTVWALGWLGVLALGCGAAGVQGLSEPASSEPKPRPQAPSASDYQPHLDVLALGFADGSFELRSPAPEHVLARGKHGAPVIDVALSSDGRRLASLDSGGTLAVSEVETGALTLFTASGGEPSLAACGGAGLAWDPMGRNLVVACGQVVRSIAVESGDSSQAELDEAVTALGFAPGGTQLVAAGTRLHFLSWPELRETRTLAAAARGERVGARAFSPDGRYLGVVLPRQVAFLEVASGSWARAHFHQLSPLGLRFAADGRVALFGRRSLYVGQPDVTNMEAAARATSGELLDVEFREDGSLMLLGDVLDAELSAVAE